MNELLASPQVSGEGQHPFHIVLLLPPRPPNRWCVISGTSGLRVMHTALDIGPSMPPRDPNLPPSKGCCQQDARSGGNEGLCVSQVTRPDDFHSAGPTEAASEAGEEGAQLAEWAMGQLSGKGHNHVPRAFWPSSLTLDQEAIPPSHPPCL